jgi:hypothetical protein
VVTEPAPMSDEDVEAMAAGGTTALKRRIAKHSPSERTGRLTDDKTSPADISTDEMARIQPRGRLTKALRQRLAKAATRDEPAEPVGSKKQEPKRKPDGA